MLAARSKSKLSFSLQNKRMASPYLKRSKEASVSFPLSFLFNTLKSLGVFVITTIIMLVDHQYLFLKCKNAAAAAKSLESERGSLFQPADFRA